MFALQSNRARQTFEAPAGFSSTAMELTMPKAAEKRSTVKKPKRVVTVTGLIRAMGGVDACAEYLGASPAQVASWPTSDVPTGWHFRLHWRLMQKGYAVDPVALSWVAKGNMLTARQRAT